MTRATESPESRTAVEAAIASIWREALHLDTIDSGEAFLDLGGDSLSATRVCWGVAERFNVVVPVTFMFDYPTIHDLTSHVLVQCEQQGG